MTTATTTRQATITHTVEAQSGHIFRLLESPGKIEVIGADRIGRAIFSIEHLNTPDARLILTELMDRLAVACEMGWDR